MPEPFLWVPLNLSILADVASPSPSPGIHGFPGGIWGVLGSVYVIFVIIFSLVWSWGSNKRRKEVEAKLEAAQTEKDLEGQGALFKFYNAQLRIYQNETRERARQSFGWAILSIMVGFTVLAVGAVVIVLGSFVGLNGAVLSGSSLAAIGGALSAFITKTLLDVHKVSLIQLNRYFKQPVLNSHVLTCQRLVKEMPNQPEEKGMYKLIIKEVAALLSAEQKQSVILEEQKKATPSVVSWKAKRQKQEGDARHSAQDDAQAANADRTT